MFSYAKKIFPRDKPKIFFLNLVFLVQDFSSRCKGKKSCLRKYLQKKKKNVT